MKHFAKRLISFLLTMAMIIPQGMVFAAENSGEEGHTDHQHDVELMYEILMVDNGTLGENFSWELRESGQDEYAIVIFGEGDMPTIPDDIAWN